MKKISILIAVVFALSFGLAPVVAAEPGTLLSPTGAIGSGNEDRIVSLLRNAFLLFDKLNLLN